MRTCKPIRIPWLLFLAAALLPTAAPTAQAQSIETRSPTVLDRPSAAAAEDPAKAIAYDVVSIHLNKSDSPGGSARSNPDGDVMVNQSLEGMIGPAYGVEPDQVYGLPAWVKTNRYDMQFKVAAEDIPAYGKLHGRESMRMLQAVLEDRLKLKAHLGSKEVPMYNLVIAKDGPKLHQAKDGDTYADGIKMPDGTPVGSSWATMGRGMFRGQQVTVGSLVNSLKSATGRQVVDKTGLTGKYDISLRWMPDEGPPPMLNGEPDTSLPSIYTVLEDQLGLKLESTKGPIKTLVIDHIELPSEN
jgi:uncharacterized protein (TIGR03435 family)